MIYRNLIVFLIVVVLTGCKKELPSASFTFSPADPEIGETVFFSNTSTHATGYSWDFGDGTSFEGENTSHIYSEARTFAVELTATNEDGSDSYVAAVEVDWPPPVADFSKDKSEAAPGEIITFTNLSQNATSYTWDFGDGLSSSAQNPTHSYGAAGTYTVQLTATGPGGTHSTSQQISIILTVTGQWNKTFELSGEVFDGTMNLVQHPDGSLTGDFVFSDGSGYTALVSSSYINNRAIQIDWLLSSTYLMSYQGTVSTTFDYMSGAYYVDGAYVSTWSATKIAKKKAPAFDGANMNPAIDRLLDKLKNE